MDNDNSRKPKEGKPEGYISQRFQSRIQVPGNPATAGFLARYQDSNSNSAANITGTGSSTGNGYGHGLWPVGPRRTLRPLTADTHPIVNKWEVDGNGGAIRQPLLQLLRQKGIRYTMVGLFLVDQRPASPAAIAPIDATATATLVVAVQPGSIPEDLAMDMTCDLCALLDEHRLLTNLDIEVVEAEVKFLTSSTASAHQDMFLPFFLDLGFQDNYSATPQLGCSIGPNTAGGSSLSPSGSMGPVLRLRLHSDQVAEQETRLLAITYSVDAIPIRLNRNADQWAEPRRIESPSFDYHARWLSRASKTDLKVRRKVMEEVAFGMRPESSLSDPDFDKAATRIRIAENFDCELGTIFNTSGLHTYPKPEPTTTTAAVAGIYRSPCRLDYGTVELTTSRSSGPFPKINPARLELIINDVPPSCNRREGVVFACGRTTPYRRGELLGPAVVARLYASDGRMLSETLERAIVPYEYKTDPPFPPGASRPPPFAESGDSGALVFDLHQRVGILWGGMECQSQESTDASSPRLEWVPPQVEPINVEDVVFYTPVDAIVSSLKNQLAEAYGEGNFTLRWADENDDAPGL